MRKPLRFAFVAAFALCATLSPALDRGLVLSVSASPFAMGVAPWHDIEGVDYAYLSGSGTEWGVGYRVGRFELGGAIAMLSLEETLRGKADPGVALAMMTRPSLGARWYPADWFFVGSSLTLDFTRTRDGSATEWDHGSRSPECASVMLKAGFERMDESGFGIFADYAFTQSAWSDGLYASYAVSGRPRVNIGNAECLSMSVFELGIRWAPGKWLARQSARRDTASR